jgi:hypothetical protein
MFYFGYKMFHPPKQQHKAGPSFAMEIVCKSVRLAPETAKIIAVGDKERDAQNQVIGEVISVGEIMPYSYEIDIGSGNIVVKQDSVLKQVILRLRLNTVFSDGKMYYKNSAININEAFNFTTNKYALEVISISEYRAAGFEERDLIFYITLKDLDNKTLGMISKGDKDVGKDGNVLAEILSLGKVGNSAFVFDLGNSLSAAADDASKKQILVKMRMECQLQENNQVYFKNKRIEADSPLSFDMGKYKAIGEVYRYYDPSFIGVSQKWVSVQVKFSGVMPEVGNILKAGDAERNLGGQIVSKIVTIMENKPSEALALRDNNWITLKHPFYRDILVHMDVLCSEKEGMYYFNNFPLKVGNNITFNAELYSISGVILSFAVQN